ncbi:MAG: hypothetical protein QM778_28645 [Myxococcales bacterium]
MRLAPLLALVMLGVLLCGCRHLGITPRHPRVASASEHRFELGDVHQHAIPTTARGAISIDVHVQEIPAGTEIRWVAVADATLAPCSKGYEALHVRTTDARGQVVSNNAAKVGDTLSIGLSVEAWGFMLSRASRLDLMLVNRHGLLKCAAFPLVDERPQHAWDPLESWTFNTLIGFEHLNRRIDGMDGLVSFTAEVGKWVGPLRLHLLSGGGASECTRDVCPSMPGSGNKSSYKNEKYYVPVGLGVGGVLLQWWMFALETKAEYRLGFTAQETFHGLHRSILHGPVITPSLMLTLPHPLAPGVPGGLRRGLGVGASAPLAYYMSTSGQSAFSWGIGLAIMLPLR